MPKVKVPFIPQRNPNDCVVTCMLMVMTWARAKYADVAEFKYEELARILEWDRDGTPLKNVVKLNSHKRIRKFTYQPEFYYGWATGMSFIWDEIDIGRPIIAYLLQKHLDSHRRHSVVVIGHSNDRTRMHLNDPSNDGPILVPVGEFQDEWNSLYRTNAHVRVVERLDTKIEDFVEEEE